MAESISPYKIKPDPRTDGAGDGGENELEPLSEEEIRAGVEHDRRRALDAEPGWWPFR